MRRETRAFELASVISRNEIARKITRRKKYAIAHKQMRKRREQHEKYQNENVKVTEKRIKRQMS